MMTRFRPTIRLYSLADETAVLNIVADGVAAQQRLAAELDLPKDTPYVDHGGANSQAALHDRPGDCYVAVINGEVVGFMRVDSTPVIVERDGDLHQIDHLAVEEIDVAAPARGHHVGTELLAHAEEIARTRGCEIVGLLYLKNNQASAKVAQNREFTLTRADLGPHFSPQPSGTVTRAKYLPPTTPA